MAEEGALLSSNWGLQCWLMFSSLMSVIPLVYCCDGILGVLVVYGVVLLRMLLLHSERRAGQMFRRRGRDHPR